MYYLSDKAKARHSLSFVEATFFTLLIVTNKKSWPPRVSLRNCHFISRAPCPSVALNAFQPRLLQVYGGNWFPRRQAKRQGERQDPPKLWLLYCERYNIWVSFLFIGTYWLPESEQLTLDGALNSILFLQTAMIAGNKIINSPIK